MKTDTPAFANLQAEAERLSAVHLADLLGDDVRARALVWQMDDLRVDLSRQLLTPSTMSDLLSLAQTCNLEAKIKALFAGIGLISAKTGRWCIWHSEGSSVSTARI